MQVEAHLCASSIARTNMGTHAETVSEFIGVGESCDTDEHRRSSTILTQFLVLRHPQTPIPPNHGQERF